MFALGFDLASRAALALPAGSGAAAAPGTARPDFSALGLTPAFLYHPHTETGTTLSSGEVTAVAGMSGSPALQKGTTGPLERSDALGRKLWSFRGSDFLECLPANFTSTPRAFTVILVGRAHSGQATINYFGHSYLSDGVTVDSITGAMLASYGTSGAPNYIRSTGLSSYSAGATALAHMCIGQQMQVFGAAGRTTANGGTRYLMNRVGVNHSQPQNANANMKGFRIGGYAKSNGSTNTFDCYCAVAFHGELTDAQCNAVMGYLADHYAIPDVTRQLILEGDSITFGIPNATIASYERPGMAVCGPGGFLPDDVRVMNIAQSGSQTSNLVTRRDSATGGWPGSLLPGGAANNRVYFQIGNNDCAPGAGNKTAATTYADIVAYLNTASTGVLQRGFSVAVGINIGSNVNTTLRDRLLELRTLLRAGQFETDTATNAGGTYAGLLQRVELPLVQVGAAFPFESPPTGSSTYFWDGTHVTAAGSLLQASGGDTPQHGIGSLY